MEKFHIEEFLTFGTIARDRKANGSLVEIIIEFTFKGFISKLASEHAPEALLFLG